MELQSIGPSPYAQPQAQRDELRDNIIELIARWIRQKPGLDPRNYISDWRDADGRAAYRADSRTITRQRHDAFAMLRYIELRPSITGADLAAALTVGGRLSMQSVRRWACDCGHKYTAPVQKGPTANLSGEMTAWCPKCGARPAIGSAVENRLDYTTGQYWPMEFRAAACRVLASVIWQYFHHGAPTAGADTIRRMARQELGRAIADRWFR